MLVSRIFTFDSAHQLREYRGKCENLHGHTYRLQVTLDCPVGADGLAFDFVRLKEEVQGKVLDRLDHVFLNEIIPQPTAEHIAIWIWKELAALPLAEITVGETPTCFVTYRGEGSPRPA